MAGKRQTHIRRGRHRERVRSLRRPVRAIRGIVSGERISIPHELDPIRRGQAAGGGVAAAAARARAGLPSHAVARSHRDKGIRRIRIGAFADHDTGFGPGINVLHRDDAGNHGAISGDGHIGKAEGVGRAPDVRPGASHREHAAAVIRAACQSHRAHVQRHPRIWQRHIRHRFRAVGGRHATNDGADHVVVVQADGGDSVSIIGCGQAAGNGRVRTATTGRTLDVVTRRIGQRVPL